MRLKGPILRSFSLTDIRIIFCYGTRPATLGAMKIIASTVELERLVTDYQQHLLNDAGLTAESCRVRVCHIRAFLTSQFKPKQKLDLRQIEPRTLVDYVLEQRQRLSLETLQSVTGC